LVGLGRLKPTTKSKKNQKQKQTKKANKRTKRQLEAATRALALFRVARLRRFFLVFEAAR
jgi:hypothetical protein